MRKKIGVLVAQVDETTQNRFLTDFIAKAYELDYDVCIFSMYQKYQETVLRNIGDSNIYNLINFDVLDGIVMLNDTILTPGLSLPLQKMVKEKFCGPVLVVDKESPFFESVIMDHYSPVKKIVDHMIEVHNYKDIAFLGGKKGHPHSLQRLNAFLDSMKQHGLMIHDEWIYHGNYWYDSADSFIDKLLETPEHMPRAIVCANDYMAIGAAARLSEKGYRIPEDIAISGYDSVADGKYSPQPITSADIPADECGSYSMEWIHAKLNGREIGKFSPMAPILVGGSCGCHYKIEMVPKKLREQWRTQQSSKSMFSDFNHILEDLLSQDNYNDFFKTVLDYTHQIKPFNSFDICMCDGFMNADALMGEKALRKGYTDRMYRVLSCDNSDEVSGRIDFNTSFDTKDMFPEIYKDRDYPTTFIFNPIYFDDRCFGYAVLNYGDKIMLYKENYRVWMRTMMQAMEAFFRQNYMLNLIDTIKSGVIRDTMTGLYNYDGFIKQAPNLIDKENETGSIISILTVDIKSMKLINEIYGRKAGEHAIRVIARSIQNNTTDDEISCRMYNDEFLIGLLDDENSSRTDEILLAIEKDISDFSFGENVNYKLLLHSTKMQSKVESFPDFEILVNRAIATKNIKKNVNKQGNEIKDNEAVEEIERNKLVMKILNENLFTYHYQPIVSAKDGSIFAYEALMRYEKEKISPFHIIQSAIHLNRLNDIEKATLLNVTADVENNIEKFSDSKIFVNSLPGMHLPKKDDDIFKERLLKNKGRFVIEFTEESELNDDQLEEFKAKYNQLECNIAVDDFGAGYSNVNNLLRYMPYYVKIDRMLISGIDTNPQKSHMVKNIIEFSKDNGIVTLAEGVETREELQECIRLGIDLIQGYYTGRPSRVPLQEIDVTIRSEIERFNKFKY